MHKFLAFAGAVIFSAGVSSAWAGGCPNNPNALGVSRDIEVVAAGHAPIGSLQYRETLPLADHEVVLTFDDGPSVKHTGRVLDILASECVKATFFMVGQMANRSPELVRRAFKEGHSIGSHTQNHPFNMHSLPLKRMKKEIDDGAASVRTALGDYGKAAPFFRIPGLDRSRQIEKYANSRGLMVWSIDIDSDDWTPISSTAVVTRVMNRLRRKGRGVILMHDIHQRTAAALPKLLKRLKDGGYHIVHVKPERDEEPKTAANDKSLGDRLWQWRFPWE
jgi:peptidoglycan/xylan/chitin deacetylase (PgdA/CDA1 family)